MVKAGSRSGQSSALCETDLRRGRRAKKNPALYRGDKDEAVERARAPFCEYLRAHIDLIQAMDLQSDLNSDSDLEILVQAAFEQVRSIAYVSPIAKQGVRAV